MESVFSVGVVNRVNSAPVDILESAYFCLTSCSFLSCTGNCWLSEPCLRLIAAVVVTLVVALLSVSLAIACGTCVCDTRVFTAALRVLVSRGSS